MALTEHTVNPLGELEVEVVLKFQFPNYAKLDIETLAEKMAYCIFKLIKLQSSEDANEEELLTELIKLQTIRKELKARPEGSKALLNEFSKPKKQNRFEKKLGEMMKKAEDAKNS